MNKLQNILQRINNNIYQFNRLIKIPVCVRYLLIPGCYKYNSTCTVLYNVKFASTAELVEKNLFGVNSTTENLFRLLFSKIFHIFVNSNEQSNFHLLVISTSGMEYKLFDVDESLIATYYEDETRMKNIIINRTKWAEFFNTIPFSVDEGNKFIFESLYNHNQLSAEKEFLIILEDYKKYYSILEFNNNVNIDIEKLQEFYSKIGKSNDCTGMNAYVKELNEYKTCLTHGDLWYSNIIFDGHILFYLDFEMVKERIFFYDLIYYIVSEFSIRKNSVLIENYAKGIYDKAFSELFELAGTKYDSSKKRWYIELCYFILYSEKWEGTEYESNIDIVKRSLGVFDYYGDN